MPIDSSLYAQFAPRVQSALDVQNGLAQQAQAQAQLQNNALAAQKMRMGIDEQQQLVNQRNALRQAVDGGQIDLSNPDHAAKALAIAPDIAPTLLKTIQEGQEKAAKAQSDKATAASKALSDYRSLLPMVRNQQDMAQWIDGMFANPLTAPIAQQFGGTPEQAKARIPTDPQEFQTFLQKNAMGMDNFIQEQGRNNRSAATITAENARSAATNATSVKVAGIHEAGANQRQGETIANSRVLAGLNPDGSPKTVVGADGTIDLKQVSPEDLAAAYRYKTDGTMPSNMARGVQGGVESRRIRSIAAAIDAQAGESPEDARIRQLAAKGDIGALNQMRKREVAVGANVKNFDFNADQVLQLSQKVDRSGVPIANAWINAGRRAVTGNPELSAFDTAVKTTVNEFAQIVSGTTAGATTEGEKKKAEALLNAQQTPEQIVSTINQMRIESQNRMKSFRDQRAESMPTNAARPAASPTSAGVPDDIAAILKKHGGK